MSTDNIREMVKQHILVPVNNINPENYDNNCKPKHFRTVDDIYANIEEVEIEDELMLMGIDKAPNYGQATKERNWKQVMQKEINSIEKNDTWTLTELLEGLKFIGLK